MSEDAPTMAYAPVPPELAAATSGAGRSTGLDLRGTWHLLVAGAAGAALVLWSLVDRPTPRQRAEGSEATEPAPTAKAPDRETKAAGGPAAPALGASPSRTFAPPPEAGTDTPGGVAAAGTGGSGGRIPPGTGSAGPEPSPVPEEIRGAEEGDGSPAATPAATGRKAPRKRRRTGRRGSAGSQAAKKKSSPSSRATRPGAPPRTEPAKKPQPSAGELLARARRSLQSGRYATAYAQASASYAKKRSHEAAELMVRAACGMKHRSKAASALKKVRLVRRPKLRRACRKQGVSI